jgi:hypothetical protein
MVGDMASALVAVSPVFEEAAITPSTVDVHPLSQQAGGQISQGEQPTSPLQRRSALSSMTTGQNVPLDILEDRFGDCQVNRVKNFIT